MDYTEFFVANKIGMEDSIFSKASPKIRLTQLHV